MAFGHSARHYGRTSLSNDLWLHMTVSIHEMDRNVAFFNRSVSASWSSIAHLDAHICTASFPSTVQMYLLVMSIFSTTISSLAWLPTSNSVDRNYGCCCTIRCHVGKFIVLVSSHWRNFRLSWITMHKALSRSRNRSAVSQCTELPQYSPWRNSNALISPRTTNPSQTSSEARGSIWIRRIWTDGCMKFICTAWDQCFWHLLMLHVFTSQHSTPTRAWSKASVAFVTLWGQSLNIVDQPWFLLGEKSPLSFVTWLMLRPIWNRSEGFALLAYCSV